MNEVFEYRRFGALARKYYRENRRLGIIFLGIIGIITFLCLCKFNPFLREYTQVENPAEVSDFIQYYKGVYRQLFWGLYGLFALVVALHSLRDFVVKDKILNTLLLPASVFEKYVLAFLNSTVVLLVVYLLMFYALASVANSYKFTQSIGVCKREFRESGPCHDSRTGSGSYRNRECVRLFGGWVPDEYFV